MRHRLRAALACAALLSPASRALAARITEFPVTTGRSPWAITAGADGALWFTETASPGSIGRMTVAGVLTDERQAMSTASVPQGICSGPEGFITYIDTSGSGRIAGRDPFNSVPIAFEASTINAPTQISCGPDKRVYFTQASHKTYAYRDAETGGVSAGYSLWDATSTPAGLVVAPDGNLWVVEESVQKVGWTPRFFIVGDGSAAITGASDPKDIAYGWDGALWITDPGTNKIFRVSHSGTLVTSYPTTNANPRAIIRGPGSKLWFLENGLLGSIATNGTITEYPLPTATSQGLAWGPDGNIWFTDPGSSKIGRFVVRVPGDVNDDGLTDVADVFYRINVLYAGGPAPK